MSLRKELISMVELEKALQRVGLQAACKKRCCEPGILCECVSVCARAFAVFVCERVFERSCETHDQRHGAEGWGHQNCGTT